MTYWEGIENLYQAKDGYLQGDIENPEGADKPDKSYWMSCSDSFNPSDLYRHDVWAEVHESAESAGRSARCAVARECLSSRSRFALQPWNAGTSRSLLGRSQ